MCGIIVLIGAAATNDDISRSMSELRYRGPDNSRLYKGKLITMGFTRLAIMDLSSEGDQPMEHPEDPDLMLVCNGEIYNYRYLEKKYGFQQKSSRYVPFCVLIKTNTNIYLYSDCEAILHLYKYLSIDDLVRSLDGVFAFVLFDERKNLLYIARDPYGVRPLFYTITKCGGYAIASEVKALQHIAINEGIRPFPPGHYQIINLSDYMDMPIPYFSYDNLRPRMGQGTLVFMP